MKIFIRLFIFSIFSFINSTFTVDLFRNQIDQLYTQYDKPFDKDQKNLAEVTQDLARALMTADTSYKLNKQAIDAAINAERNLTDTKKFVTAFFKVLNHIKTSLQNLDYLKDLKIAYESTAQKVTNAVAPDFVTWFMNGVNTPIDSPATNQTALDYAVAFDMPETALTLIKYGSKNHTSNINIDGAKRQTKNLLQRIKDEAKRQQVADALK